MKFQVRLILPLMALASLLTSSCGDRVEEKKPVTIVDSTALNPNGDSELAKLMREMADFMDKTRERIVSGDSLLPYPEHFIQIHTAQSTPGMVEEQTMRVMGSSYIEGLKRMYEGPTAERKTGFNVAVNACKSCHEYVCPGPLKRIGKLSIP